MSSISSCPEHVQHTCLYKQPLQRQPPSRQRQPRRPGCVVAGRRGGQPWWQRRRLMAPSTKPDEMPFHFVHLIWIRSFSNEIIVMCYIIPVPFPIRNKDFFICIDVSCSPDKNSCPEEAIWHPRTRSTVLGVEFCIAFSCIIRSIDESAQ
jgi:hypothetical protein